MKEKTDTMKREIEPKKIITEIRLNNCPEGPVLVVAEPKNEVTETYFPGWSTPLSPWGGFSRRRSALEVTNEEGENTLCILPAYERALVYETTEFRDADITAQIKPQDASSEPHMDRSDCTEALVGLVFRVQTSRQYYQFGIEGQRRAVLYRRSDDEWFVLSEQPISIVDQYVTLQVQLEGATIRCLCPELDIDFLVTDTTFKLGKFGIRSLGESKLKFLEISQTPSQTKRDKYHRNLKHEKERQFGERIPDPVLVKTFDLEKLGAQPVFHDFIVPNRNDILITSNGSLSAMTVEGELIWKADESVEHIVFSKSHGRNGRLIYGIVKTEGTGWGDLIVLQGTDGKVTARTKCPEFHPSLNMPDLSPTSCNFSQNRGTDIVLREWRGDKGGGGVNLWAYDKDLNPLWDYEMKNTAWYGHGHALQFFDVDKDGRDELLAGGTLFDAEGNVIWVHDRDQEVLNIYGGQHYDAVALGAFANDKAIDPVAFLITGSAGVYVVDALTGRTRVNHRMGHAQGYTRVKVRADLPGEQILVVTRWGNMGILSLFSGYGDRLWTIQPDYLGQGSTGVYWGNMETQLIWMNTSGPVQSFYDGCGRRIKQLTELQHIWGDQMPMHVSARVIRLGDNPMDHLALSFEGRMYIFAPQL